MLPEGHDGKGSKTKCGREGKTMPSRDNARDVGMPRKPTIGRAYYHLFSLKVSKTFSTASNERLFLGRIVTGGKDFP